MLLLVVVFCTCFKLACIFVILVVEYQKSFLRSVSALGHHWSGAVHYMFERLLRSQYPCSVGVNLTALLAILLTLTITRF